MVNFKTKLSVKIKTAGTSGTCFLQPWHPSYPASQQALAVGDPRLPADLRPDVAVTRRQDSSGVPGLARDSSTTDKPPPTTLSRTDSPHPALPAYSTSRSAELDLFI